MELPGWRWAIFEALALLLALVATALRSKLWPVVLPLALGTFLLVFYIMGS